MTKPESSQVLEPVVPSILRTPRFEAGAQAEEPRYPRHERERQTPSTLARERERDLPTPDLHQLFGIFDAAVGFLALMAVIVGTSLGSQTTLSSLLAFRFSVLQILLVGSGCIVWTQLLYLLGLHDPLNPLTRKQVMLSILIAGGIGAAMVASALILAGVSPPRGLGLGAVFLLSTTPAALAVRLALRWLTDRARARMPYATVIIGSGPMAASAAAGIRRRNGRGTLLGFFDEFAGGLLSKGDEPWLGRIDDLERFLMWNAVDEVLIALPVKSFYSEIQRVVAVCEKAGIRCRHSAHFFTSVLARPRIEGATISLIPAPDDARLIVKRAVDMMGAAVALAALSPILVACALAIRISSGGPVFFVQERYGYRKRRFRMYKFRTMEPDAQERQQVLECLNEAKGATFKIQDDPRVTPVGRFLRRTSLDELPQLVNVLRGEMSLVGPRPLPTRDVHNFEEAHLMRRFSVVPGITGLWQVSGRSNLTFVDWMGLDLDYVDRWSLALDLKILFQTIPAVLRGEGAV